MRKPIISIGPFSIAILTQPEMDYDPNFKLAISSSTLSHLLLTSVAASHPMSEWNQHGPSICWWLIRPLMLNSGVVNPTTLLTFLPWHSRSQEWYWPHQQIWCKPRFSLTCYFRCFLEANSVNHQRCSSEIPAPLEKLMEFVVECGRWTAAMAGAVLLRAVAGGGWAQ